MSTAFFKKGSLGVELYVFKSEEIDILYMILGTKMFPVFLKENLFICGPTSTSRCYRVSELSHPSGFSSRVISLRKLSLMLSLTLCPIHPYLSPSAQWRCLPDTQKECLARFGCAFLEDRGDVLSACMALYLMLRSQCLAQTRQNAHF